MGRMTAPNAARAVRQQMETTFAHLNGLFPFAEIDILYFGGRRFRFLAIGRRVIRNGPAAMAVFPRGRDKR